MRDFTMRARLRKQIITRINHFKRLPLLLVLLLSIHMSYT